MKAGELDHIFSKMPEVKAVYLFGSQAKGNANSDSDYDFAIVPSNVLAIDISKLKEKALSALTLAGFDKISVVVLDFSDLYLSFEAIKFNQLIYAIPNFEKNDYYSQVICRYLDIQPYLHRQIKAYKDRELNG